jgi:flagellar basal body P-ring protein FlgI
LPLLLLAALPAAAERIKDIATVAGVRANQLVGYGLVVGLDGTGDQTSQTPFTVQSMKNMLNQYGITLPADVNPQLKNVAAVTIHADLPPFAKPGQTIDITVSSLGNAKSLRGGSLLMSPLKAATVRASASTCRASAASPTGPRWNVPRRPASAPRIPSCSISISRTSPPPSGSPMRSIPPSAKAPRSRSTAPRCR